jgi:isopropylmalate/homocitrate/citramalate synthase
MFQSSQFIKNTIQNCYKRKALLEKINPILFDVSLRDGIQNAKPENFPLSKKIDIFHSILQSNMAANIEIGSLASPKLLPIMGDSLAFFNNISNQIDDIKSRHECSRDLDENSILRAPKIYMLIPSIEKLRVALINDIKNFSFITSVSNQFQLRNTNKTIQDKKNELKAMSEMLIREPRSQTFQTKLYISCINRCPFIGKIDNDLVLKEILHYHTEYLFDEICLSDTMGTLHVEDFSYIVDNCIYFGMPPSKLSLHLHVKKENFENIQEIIFHAFSKNINKFDVSCLETGGCSVTMKQGLTTNLTYEMFYNTLLRHLDRKIFFENL